MCERTIMKERLRQIEGVLLTRFQEVLVARPCTLVNYSSDRGRKTYKDRESLKHGERLAFLASLLSKSEFCFLQDIFRDALKYLTDKMMNLELSNGDLFYLVKKVVVLDCVTDLKSDFYATAKESLFQNAYWVSDVSYITDFLKLLPQMHTQEDNERIIGIIDNIVDNHLDDNDPQFLKNQVSRI